MKKVIIIGSPGSGKSTFARELQKATNLPLYYLDMIWHKPDQTNISQEEFDSHLEQILAKDSWIIDGNYQRTLEKRLLMCDTAILLDFPMELCLNSIQQRIGCKREDMPWVEKQPDPEFEQFVREFPVERLPQIYEMLNCYEQGRDIMIFKTRAEAREWLEKIDDVDGLDEKQYSKNLNIQKIKNFWMFSI